MPADAEDPASPAERLLGIPVVAVIVVLIAARMVVVALLLDRAADTRDEGILRYGRVATSPVTPYRNFTVEWMPIETLAVRLVGGDGDAATARRVAVVALVADLGTAAAIWFGWGRRPAAVFLLFGLPLVAVAYARLDGIAVAFAVWAFALARRRREGGAGAALALAALSGLWAALLLPWAVVRRRRPILVAAAGVLAAGGAAWYVVGGPKGPMQVLSYRGSTGWDVEGTVGGMMRLIGVGPTFVETGALRIGFAPAWARALLLVLALAATAWAWARWTVDGGDPAGRPALAVTAAVVGLAPTSPLAWTAIVVPWAAVLHDEDPGPATLAAFAAATTGVIGALATEGSPFALQLLVPIRGALVLSTAAVLLFRRRGYASAHAAA
jgi:hypothetical protein